MAALLLRAHTSPLAAIYGGDIARISRIGGLMAWRHGLGRWAAADHVGELTIEAAGLLWAAAVGGVGKPRARAPPWAGLHLTLGSLSLGPVRLDGRVGSDYEGPSDKSPSTVVRVAFMFSSHKIRYINSFNY